MFFNFIALHASNPFEFGFNNEQPSWTVRAGTPPPSDPPNLGPIGSAEKKPPPPLNPRVIRKSLPLYPDELSSPDWTGPNHYRQESSTAHIAPPPELPSHHH